MAVGRTEEATMAEDLIAILNRAMSMEYGALFLLSQHIGRVQDENVKRLLRSVEEMELAHAEKTAALIFSHGGVPNADLPQLRPRETLREILEVHMDGEIRAIDLYTRAAQAAEDPAARGVLDELRREEEQHLQAFRAALERMAGSGA
jgi:rubrerythrin